MDYECWALGDCALLLRFGSRIDNAVNARVHAVAASLAAARLPGIRAIAPGYAAVVVTLDLPAMERAGGSEALRQQFGKIIAATGPTPVATARDVAIPTRYGGADGPDLDMVAQRLGMSADEVVILHSTACYEVAMVGFQPGFPYLLGLPERLRLPRRDAARAQVAAGSVAIAGDQAGIYPNVSPGGWHLIGRTELSLFDPARAEPSLLLPGDRVRFVPVR